MEPLRHETEARGRRATRRASLIAMRRLLRLSGESRKDLREGLGSLMLCNLGDYISGFFLAVVFEPIIRSNPFLLGLLPAASDARGDVYSSYGSRLGTLLHLGLYKRHRKSELYALFFLMVTVNIWIGFIVYILSSLVHGSDVSLLDIVFIALASAIAAAVFMVPAVTWLAVYSFHRGLDPDNLVSPIATLFGDMVTIPSIVLGYEAAIRIPAPARILFIAASLSAAAGLFAYLMRRGGPDAARAARIVKENLAVILLATSFSAAAGAILVDNTASLFKWPGLLVVVPAFLEDGGAIACRFSARLATRLHLGTMRPRCYPPTKWTVEQLLVNLVHAAVVFTSLGMMGAAVNIYKVAATALVTAKIFAAILLGGIFLAVVISIISYCMAIVSFRVGLDPDNVLAPLLTSIADILGVLSLLAFARLLGL